MEGRQNRQVSKALCEKSIHLTLFEIGRSMTQIGEGIAVTIARLEEGKCIFCGRAEHGNKKKDEIKPAGWKRKSKFEGVGGNFGGKKKLLYPNNESPPSSTYRSEGHHCLAFSAFIVDADIPVAL